MVTLLTNYDLDKSQESSNMESSTRADSLVKAANKEKIEIINIKVYYEKWLSS
jgi:allophanate hydrolase subunit 1